MKLVTAVRIAVLSLLLAAGTANAAPDLPECSDLLANMVVCELAP